MKDLFSIAPTWMYYTFLVASVGMFIGLIIKAFYQMRYDIWLSKNHELIKRLERQNQDNVNDFIKLLGKR